MELKQRHCCERDRESRARDRDVTKTESARRNKNHRKHDGARHHRVGRPHDGGKPRDKTD